MNIVFKKTPKQDEANALLQTKAKHILIRGGARSGKTFILVRALVARALKEKSRHLIIRKHFAHVKQSIWYDTLPAVLELCFPGFSEICVFNKSDWFVLFPNGSEIWFGGLDDKERTDKILGKEYSSIFFNECSEMSYESVGIAQTRLAQKNKLAKKFYYDCVSGDTVLDGHVKTIKELTDEGRPISVLTTYGIRQASVPWMNGYGKMYQVKTESGHEIKVTDSHRFWTEEGWKRCDQITIGHKILCSDESRFSRAKSDVLDEMKTIQDSRVNCYKYHHQYDEQFLPPEVSSQVYLASSSDEAQHNQYAHQYYDHDEQGLHMVHLFQRAFRHIHHNQVFRKLLLPKFFFRILRMEFFSCWQVFEQFLQILRSCLVSVEDSLQTESSISIFPAFPSSYNSLDSSDIPRLSGYKFSSVVSINEKTAENFYTIEVPSVKHYVANGIVSHNCNPPKENHWTNKLFLRHVNPINELGEPISDPDNYATIKINPRDNVENLDPSYIPDILEKLPPALRLRFLDGEYGSDNADIIRAEWLIPSVNLLPENIMAKFSFCDPAYTEKARATENSCESSIVTVGIDYDGMIHDLEALHGFWSYEELKKNCVAVHARHKSTPTYIFGVEDVAAQRWLSEDLSLIGVNTILVPADGDKIRRAISVTDIMEQGKTRVNNPALINQLLGFPGERLKDLVDAYVGCLKLVKKYGSDKYDRPVDEFSGLDGRSIIFWKAHKEEKEGGKKTTIGDFYKGLI